MPPPTISSEAFSPDILHFIRLLGRYKVRYVVVGGEAVIFHGYPRLTGDIDFFFDGTARNASRLFSALADFWDGNVPEIADAAELLEPGAVIQFGRPPHRIDLLNKIDGVSFDRAWKSRVRASVVTETDAVSLNYIGKKTLLRNKRASGRAKDMDDVEHLSARGRLSKGTAVGTTARGADHARSQRTRET